MSARRIAAGVLGLAFFSITSAAHFRPLAAAETPDLFSGWVVAVVKASHSAPWWVQLVGALRVHPHKH
jgi:hypothetical protein